MAEFIIWSLLVGSLGIETVFVSVWLQTQELIQEQQEYEEEEVLTFYEPEVEAIASVPEKSSPEKSSLEKLSPEQSSNRHQKPQGKNSPKNSHLIGWEFKIVRANRDVFRNPATFRRLCQEEAEFGWILLEKLDDRRVRFKRPIGMRNIMKPEVPKFDPYRCQFGFAWQWENWFVGIAFLVAALLPAYLGYVLVSTTVLKSNPGFLTQPEPILPPPTESGQQ